jgi:hypothetical protein
MARRVSAAMALPIAALNSIAAVFAAAMASYRRAKAAMVSISITSWTSVACVRVWTSVSAVTAAFQWTAMLSSLTIVACVAVPTLALVSRCCYCCCCFAIIDITFGKRLLLCGTEDRPPPNRVAVYLMWGIEGIDRSTTTAESLVSGDLGSVIYDEKFNFESSRQVF